MPQLRLSAAETAIKPEKVEIMRSYLIPLFLSLTALNTSVAETPNETAALPQAYTIGISPYLDKSVKDDVYRSIVRLLVEDLPLNSTVTIYDAFELKTITQVTLPKARVFNSAKTRANQFAAPIGSLKSFLAQEHQAPTNQQRASPSPSRQERAGERRSTTTPQLRFEGAIRVPQFLDFLAENLAPTNSQPAVLLIGSPLYQDAKEPAFSMVDGYFPSDGHLQASREKSVFGFTGDTEGPPHPVVHWIYFGDPWVSDLHKEKITRFWTLYFERRAAQIAAFTGDLTTGLQSFRQAATGRSASSKRWAVD
jgi:hypothetical protein